MVDQNTPGRDEDGAGPSASTDAPMSHVHAHARTHEAFAISTADPAFNPDGKLMVNGFAFVPASTLFGAVRLLIEAAQTFRRYEAHHQNQADALLREGKENPGATQAWFEEQAGKVGDRIEKAGRNRDISERIEAFLLIDTTPRDTLTGLALSLVQDLDALMQDSGGVYDLHLNGDAAPWETLTAEGEFSDWLGSYDRLRDHLDALFPAGGIDGSHKAVQVGDPAATVRTIEAAVTGGLIPGITEDTLSIRRVKGRLFPLGDVRNDTAGRASPSTGMDAEVVDALRQAHDGAA